MRAIRRILSGDDEERIRGAVAQAESRTRGEIVPMIVHASDAYAHLHVAGGIAAAVAAFASVGAVWPHLHAAWLLLLEVVGFAVGSSIFRIDAVKRLFLSHQEIERRVFDRALRAFYEHELHKTHNATGILILASLLERRVQILADRGIHEKVGDASWKNAADLLSRAIAEGRLADGFCDAIAACGDVLARHFPAAGENSDELGNRPIQE